MTSPERIRAVLSTELQADCSDHHVENNRYLYSLKFDEAVGWQWIYHRCREAQTRLDRDVELHQIKPSGMQSFEIVIREENRRAVIDEGQNSLHDFADRKS